MESIEEILTEVVKTLKALGERQLELEKRLIKLEEQLSSLPYTPRRKKEILHPYQYKDSERELKMLATDIVKLLQKITK